MPQIYSTHKIIEQMDDLLESGDLSTKNGLRFAFTVLREAMTVVAQVEKRTIENENAYAGIAKVNSEIATRFEGVSKKVAIMWTGYQVAVWIFSAFGLSIIALIWSLITGKATIMFMP